MFGRVGKHVFVSKWRTSLRKINPQPNVKIYWITSVSAMNIVRMLKARKLQRLQRVTMSLRVFRKRSNTTIRSSRSGWKIGRGYGMTLRGWVVICVSNRELCDSSSKVSIRNMPYVCFLLNHFCVKYMTSLLSVVRFFLQNFLAHFWNWVGEFWPTFEIRWGSWPILENS